MTNNPKLKPFQGAGLGLKAELIPQMIEQTPAQVSFVEVAPENWVRVGGARAKGLRQITERLPLVCHGLSLSIGGPQPLDDEWLLELKDFLDLHQVVHYTEHLSYCSDYGQLYDLLPIPFTEDAVRYVAARIAHVQDVLQRRIGMENVSTYALPKGELTEIEFLNAVIEEADCGFHLDINNIFVNSVNHNFDPYDYLAQIPAQSILYAHIAGHERQARDLCIDTHGEQVIPAVWDLLAHAYQQYGVFPTLLERDFNLPPLPTLLQEVEQILALQQSARKGLAKDLGVHVA